MKNLKSEITVFKPEELSNFHFRDDWKMNIGQAHPYFHINRIEDVIHYLKFPVPPHKKTLFDFIFLTKGSSNRCKGLNEYEFSKNTFFFLPALQITSCEYITSDAQGYFCHFDFQIFNELFAKQSFLEDIVFLQHYGEPLVVVSDETRETIIFLLKRLETYYLKNQKIDLGLVSLHLATIFRELLILEKQKTGEPQNAAFLFVKKFKNLLAQHIFETKKISDYADLLSISPEHLSRCVKTVTGKSSQDVLIDMIILEAKVLLKQTDLSVGEIAFKFSETNPSDFIRLFKNKVGITPKKYRQ